MKILVVGSGGREHALAWKLAQSDRIQKIYVAPGNGGTALDPRLENVDITDPAWLAQFAIKENIVLDQVIAVGDGANDLPMLGIAGLGIAFHAKPKVRESAKQQISTAGLDGILYLIGVRDRDVEPLTRI